MKKLPLLVTATTLSLLHLSSFSQNDSTRLDAGGVVLKRPFTQNVSIKGEDLEKMPFANLSEAINVWLNGVYTIRGNIIFVVDGNIVGDMNAYSIHDVKEVILVQNAGVLTGTAGNQQQIVLITTRQGRDTPGIRAAAQTFLVHSPGASTSLYHQYFVSAGKSFKKISAGISANYLRDVVPMMKQEGVKMTPYHMDRWRVNGNFTWRPNTKNTVEVHAGFVPQVLDSAQHYTNPKPDINSYLLNRISHLHAPDQQLFSWAQWRGEWLPGLRNDLQVGYIHLSQTYKYSSRSQYSSSASYNNNAYSEDNKNFHAHQLYVRDHISYVLHAGAWSFEPSVNITYQYFKKEFRGESFSGSGPDPSNPGISSMSTVRYTPDGSGLYVLTPVIDISYKQVLDIQGGVVMNLSRQYILYTGTLPRRSAFASIGIDLLQLDGKHRSNSLKLFGSYAQRSAYSQNSYFLNDMEGNNPPSPSPTIQVPVSLPTYYYTFLDTTILIQIGNPGGRTLPKYWVWQAGATWSVLRDRLQLEYNFERRNFSTLIVIDPPIGFSTIYKITDLESSQHRLGINYQIADRPGFNWRMGLNTTVLSSNGRGAQADHNVIGDNVPGNKKPSFTGGWVNRLQCRRISAGVNMLYHFSGETLNYYNVYPVSLAGRDNSWLMQNIYLGYQLSMPGKMALEIYLDSRGLLRGGNTSYGMDTRRYYGIGGKLSM